MRSAQQVEDGGGADGTPSWAEMGAARPGDRTLRALARADPTRLRPAELLDAISCSEHLVSQLHGLQAILLTEFARPGRAGDISRIVAACTDMGGAASTPDGGVDTDVLDLLVTDHARGMAAADMAAALDISPITARHRVDAAVDLHDGLPLTHRALLEGRIDRGRAALIADRTTVLDPDLRHQVEAAILPLTKGRTAGRLRPLIDRAVIIADPDAANRRAEKARRDRDVTHQPVKDQMSLIRAVLPADGAVTVYTLIDLLAAATRSPGDDRCIGERRADALTDLAAELLTHGHLDLRDLLDPDPPDPDPDSDPSTDDWADNDATGRCDPGGETGSGDDSGGDDSGGDDWAGHHPDSEGRHDEFRAPDEPIDPQGWPATPSAPTAPDDRVTEATPAPAPAPVPEPEPEPEPEPAERTEPAPDGPSPAPATARSAATAAVPAAHPNPPAAARRSRKRARTDAGRLLRRQGRRPHLTLTMSMSTLMALDRLPGHLDGYGAITPELAHAIACCAASLTLAVIDPVTGAPLHAGERRSYRPSQAHRDRATTLFQTCRFPSCRQPAWRCDLDHRDPFDLDHPDLGGPTSTDNLDPLCRRHHLMKHHTDWTPRRNPDGTISWTSPSGHRYDDHPREMTLPAEHLTPSPAPRTSIGLSDTEHTEACLAPLDPPDPEQAHGTSPTVRLRQAIHHDLHTQVLDRIHRAQRLGRLGHPTPTSASADPHREPDPRWVACWTDDNIDDLKARSSQPRHRAPSNQATAIDPPAHDPDEPPF